jgi:hypothetical protein
MLFHVVEQGGVKGVTALSIVLFEHIWRLRENNMRTSGLKV